MTQTTTTDLETGDVPDVVRRYLHNCADLADAVALGRGGRTLRTGALALADVGNPATIFNEVTVLDRSAFDDPAATMSRINRFYAAGTGTVYLWSADPTPDLRAWGWQPAGQLPVLIHDPGAPMPPERPVQLERVTTSAAAFFWERLLVEGFPFPEVIAHLPGAFMSEALLADRRLRLWLARDRSGRPVTCAASFVAHEVNHFVFGVTLPEARRTGHWYASVRERLAVAPQLPAVAVFTADSEPGARRTGFRTGAAMTVWWRNR